MTEPLWQRQQAAMQAEQTSARMCDWCGTVPWGVEHRCEPFFAYLDAPADPVVCAEPPQATTPPVPAKTDTRVKPGTWAQTTSTDVPTSLADRAESSGCPKCGAWPCPSRHVCWLADPPDPTVAAFTPQERAALRRLLRREGLG